MKKKLAVKEELVFIKNDDVFTDSKIISIGTGVEHRKLKNVIKKRENELNRFGKLSAPYEAESTGGRKEKIYSLNEPQATFLITLLKNTEAVVEFKFRLVEEFYRMRKFIVEKQSLEWQQAREQGKLMRRDETDVIKEFIEYAKKHGSKHADMYYIHFSKLANKIAGIHGNMRDLINARQLMYLSIAESTILKTVMRGMKQNIDYKKVYEECKHRLDVLSDLAILEEPTNQFKQERIEVNVAVRLKPNRNANFRAIRK